MCLGFRQLVLIVFHLGRRYPILLHKGRFNSVCLGLSAWAVALFAWGDARVPPPLLSVYGIQDSLFSVYGLTPNPQTQTPNPEPPTPTPLHFHSYIPGLSASCSNGGDDAPSWFTWGDSIRCVWGSQHGPSFFAWGDARLPPPLKSRPTPNSLPELTPKPGFKPQILINPRP